ncbi:response regulator transcription factor [Streptomyces sp. NA04227]|uniref:helix-turn-helix transcriptional regulator n=1 Tax=Streptomyces sp. NA04227 TaxID=2742136 RepID=UPI001591480C|nr:LuxR C-terminal-related transcriptional regulator [Streptomyces sp. NA04227]QKW07479.1 response regulator transcription factor [Streptomyces sp. NA04227]
MTAKEHRYPRGEPCQGALAAYGRALRTGYLPAAEAAFPPCLPESGLFEPDEAEAHGLLPVPPAVALPRLLRKFTEQALTQRRNADRLAETFLPLLALQSSREARRTVSAEDIKLLDGFPRINVAIEEACERASRELLTIQPGGGTRAPETLAQALVRDRALLARGARMRTLYQHTARHHLSVHAYYEELKGDAEVRTLDEVSERLVMFDREVAFVPANKDRTLALEVRHPILIDYFVTTFQRLWRLATPMHPIAAPLPTTEGITARQRAIAELLVEGETDTRIAQRLGMNVRTCRTHIANLATTLGSHSRAQLGYLIGRSGILDRDV